MLSLICAAFLTLPLYPLNPTAQDTVNAMNLHVTTGLSSQSGMISAGPEFTIKYEFLFKHPFIFRTSLDYIYGDISTVTYPNGRVHRQSISTEVVYYRGTNKLTAYTGLGFVYGIGQFNLKNTDFFTKKNLEVPEDVKLGSAAGFRFLFGLRFEKKYSLEVTITEISPSLIYTRPLGVSAFTEEKLEFRANYVKLSFGYLFQLK